MLQSLNVQNYVTVWIIFHQPIDIIEIYFGAIQTRDLDLVFFRESLPELVGNLVGKRGLSLCGCSHSTDPSIELGDRGRRRDHGNSIYSL